MSSLRIPSSQRRRGRLPSRQRGIALLVAILLVAFGTIIAAAIGYENAMTARRGMANFAVDESLLVAQGAEAFAAYGLREVQRSDKSHTVYPGQGWDTPLGPLEVVPGVMLEASLEDLQGRFNLNLLVNADDTPNLPAVAAFQRLLGLLNIEPKWAQYIIDWIDLNQIASNPDGAEDSVYMGQTPPYRTPNMYITSASELLALPGFGHDRYVKLAPYVVALPVLAKAINVCTASGPVLDAFTGKDEFRLLGPEGLAKNRASAGGCFPKRTEYQQSFDSKAAFDAVSEMLAETSSYFRLTSFVTIGSAEFNLYSLLYQDATGNVRPLLRSYTPD